MTPKGRVRVSLETPLSREDLYIAQQFIEKASELEENYLEIYKDFPLLHTPFQTTTKFYLSDDVLKDITNAEYKLSGGHKIPLSRHRIKGLYLDFRLFFANDEPINFNKFINNMGKYTTDSRLKIYLSQQKVIWKSNSLASGVSGYSELDIIRYYFNSNFFHLPDKKNKPHFERIKFICDDIALEWFTFEFIQKRCFQIFNVKQAISEIKESMIMIPMETD